MKAAVHREYGDGTVIGIKTIDIPVPKSGEILVKVHAASVNRTDCANLLSDNIMQRIVTGLLSPRRIISGTDFSGVVEQVGDNVTDFTAGDRVFGFNDVGLSSHAEYTCIKVKGNVMKMGKGSFKDYAASIEGFHYAINFINKVSLSNDDHVLIHGATGAIGSALLQLIKGKVAHITATCRAKDRSLVASLGADIVIDYEKNDITKRDEMYDFVFDAVGKSRFTLCKNILHEGGVYISSELGAHIENLYLPLITIFSSKKVIFPFPVRINASMEMLCNKFNKGEYKAVVDTVYPLDDIQEAFAYACSGKKVGSLIIEMHEQ